MTCPNCNGKNKVIDSRSDEDTVYRKRKCDDCGHIFYTEEQMVLATDGFRNAWRAYRQKKRKRWKHIRLRCDTKPMKYRMRGARE